MPWTRLLADADAERDGRRLGLLRIVREGRKQFVLKPNDDTAAPVSCWGGGVPSGWDDALQAALRDAPGTWVVQERIPVRREALPQFDADGHVTMRDMLVDVAPYLFRGRMGGYLTRLSATGLANVTSEEARSRRLSSPTPPDLARPGRKTSVSPGESGTRRVILRPVRICVLQSTKRRTDGQDREEDRRETNGKAVAKKTAKKPARKPNAAFMKPVTPSPALAEIVGAKPIPGPRSPRSSGPTSRRTACRIPRTSG